MQKKMFTASALCVTDNWIWHTFIIIIIMMMIIIIIIIFLVITFMKDVYNYIPKTNHISRVCSTAAVLYLHIVLHVLLLSSSSSFLWSPLWRMFTIIYPKRTTFLGCIVLQLFCIYNLCYMYYYHYHHLLYAEYLYLYSWDKLCP